MTIGERIKTRREELDMSQEELAIRIGYKSRSSINKIELDHQQLTQRKIKAIADALGVTANYILGISDDEKPKPPVVRIPVFSRVAAGIPIDAIDDIVDWEEITSDMAKTGEYFGLKIKGDSMQPRIAEGDTVIVRQQPDADSGDVVIVRINGDYATCKKLSKHTDGISLISFNPMYEPMNFSQEEIRSIPVEIVGKVIENRQKY